MPSAFTTTDSREDEHYNIKHIKKKTKGQSKILLITLIAVFLKKIFFILTDCSEYFL
jgi:hypothetical protein